MAACDRVVNLFKFYHGRPRLSKNRLKILENEFIRDFKMFVVLSTKKSYHFTKVDKPSSLLLPANAFRRKELESFYHAERQNYPNQ